MKKLSSKVLAVFLSLALAVPTILSVPVLADQGVVAPIQVQLNTQKDALETMDKSTVDAYSEVDIYFNVDDPNPMVGEVQVPLVTYQARVYFDPTFFELINPERPFDTSVRAGSGEKQQYICCAKEGCCEGEEGNNTCPVCGTDGKGKPCIVDTPCETEGCCELIVSNGMEFINEAGDAMTIEGVTYQSVYITYLLKGTTYPPKSAVCPDSNWYSLSKLPLKSIGKLGETKVFLEMGDKTEANGGLYLLPKYDGITYHTFDTTAYNGGLHTIEVKAPEAPAAPLASPEPGTYNQTQNVVLSKAEADQYDNEVIIKYNTSLDSTEKTYSDPITVDKSQTITAWTEKTVAGALALLKSEEAAFVYTIEPIKAKLGQVDTDGTTLLGQEAVSPVLFDESVKVWLDITGTLDPASETIDTTAMYYTFADLTGEDLADKTGDDPATQWVAADHKTILTVSESRTLKVLTSMAGANVISQYELAKRPPEVTQTATIDGTNPITDLQLFCVEEDTEIYYTVDGTDPATSQTAIRYTSGTKIAVLKDTIVRAAAKKNDSDVWSNIAEWSFEVDAAPSISPSDSSIYNNTAISISTNVLGATIYYTIDGSTPTTSSKLYNGSFYLNQSATVKAIAVLNGAESDEASAFYVVRYINNTGSSTSTGSGSTITKPSGGDEEDHLTHYKYILGYEDGSIHPDAEISREEVAALFFRLSDDGAKSSFAATGDQYADVDGGRWSVKYIEYLLDKGILTMGSDKLFRPADQITRAEFAKMLCEWKGYTKDSNVNSGADYAGHWAESYIQTLVSNGMMNGYEDGTFRPDTPITRAEAITLFNRIVGRDPNPTTINLANPPAFTDLGRDHWAYYQIIEATVDHDYDVNKNTGKEDWAKCR